jgi:L,D-transpeptidase catalytic domain
MRSSHSLHRLAWLVLALAPALACARPSGLVHPGRLDALATVDSLAARTPVPSVPLDSLASAPLVVAADTAIGHDTMPVGPVSREDSLEWVAARKVAERSRGYRLIISLYDRTLWAVRGRDTLLAAPIAVAMGTTLEYDGRTWTFATPRGRRRVVDKQTDPVWLPPEWHYAEVAREHGFRLASLSANRPVTLNDGTRLEVRNGRAGIVRPGSEFVPLVPDEEIVFDSTLFIPPLLSKNRQIIGQLGRHGLSLGDGYLLHGTPDQKSIGTASTHGCVRLRDEDIAWLYENVPVGTRVYIY